MKLSIIIPEYNNLSFCLQSLEPLVHLTGLELIVVSDIESTSDFSKTSLINLPNVKFARNSGSMLGAGACRNIGMRLARGTYICFMDSDDALNPDTIRTFLENTKDFDCCFFRVESFGEQNSRRHVRYNRLVDDIRLDRTLIAHYSVPWGKIILKQFAYDNNLLFDEILASNDIGFQAKLSRVSNLRLEFEMDSTLYYVRESQGSLTKTFTDEIILARYYAKLLNQGKEVSYTFAHNLWLSFRLSRLRSLLLLSLEIILKRKLFRNWAHLKNTLKRI